MNTLVTQKQKAQSLGDMLEKMKPQIAASLPANMKPERMVRIALNAAQNTPKLLDASRASFFSALLRAAQLGLEPDGLLGQAYLLPFDKNTRGADGKWQKETHVQLIVGYKGLLDLARRSGEITNIIAKEVCQNDDFAIAWHMEVPFHHTQALSNRGAVIGFWAMARFKDGGFHFDYMSVEEVNAIRDASQGFKASPDKSPWTTHYVEMGKKTAIRRIAKYLPMSVQREAAMADAVESGKNVEIVDGDYEIVPEAKPEIDALAELDNKAQKEAPFDPETGEILEHEAGQ